MGFIHFCFASCPLLFIIVIRAFIENSKFKVSFGLGKVKASFELGTVSLGKPVKGHSRYHVSQVYMVLEHPVYSSKVIKAVESLSGVKFPVK